jgi:hypothetical protein
MLFYSYFIYRTGDIAVVWLLRLQNKWELSSTGVECWPPVALLLAHYNLQSSGSRIGSALSIITLLLRVSMIFAIQVWLSSINELRTSYLLRSETKCLDITNSNAHCNVLTCKVYISMAWWELLDREMFVTHCIQSGAKIEIKKEL